ncbi:MAG: RNA polymerase factor sigma-54 [Limisphaerales bacterium]|jgi:RNA polymerase sigma-54 factor
MALQQVLAPQLQQSLALLQAPMLELQALVANEMAQNPVLEEVAADESHQRETDEGETIMNPVDPAEPPSDVNFDPATEKPTEGPVDDFQAEFDKLLQMDQEWRDHFAQTNVPLRSREDDDEKRQYMFDSLVADSSLQENLLEQMRLSELEESDQQVAELLIGNVDDYGYLSVSLEELTATTGVPLVKLEEVLKVVQSFQPAGVAARDLRECLMLQLERKEQAWTLEYRMIRDCMDAVGKRRIPEMARKLGSSVEQVQDAFQKIGLLDPRPGRMFLPDHNQYVSPEVFVTQDGDEFVVSTANDHIPRLRISNLYKDLMAQGDSTQEVREYIREKIRAGKFLIKSLHQRQETILNIAKEIVSRQRDFMEKGVAHLKPLTMVQVAEVVGVHETTVSRAVSGKYMETPQGLFEMKYFFTSGLQSSDGQNISNTSVKDMLADLIRGEDAGKPLSDEELVKLITAKGVKIARRTVAKYRGELNILPSHLRRRY